MQVPASSQCAPHCSARLQHFRPLLQIVIILVSLSMTHSGSYQCSLLIKRPRLHFYGLSLAACEVQEKYSEHPEIPT